MMAEVKRTCPGCGSVLPTAAEVCDICGEVVSSEQAQEKAPSRPDPKQAAPAREQRLPLAAKKKAQTRSAEAVALFTTTQWIILCVISMILGSVLTASFLPSDTTDPNSAAANGEPAALTGQPNVDLDRLATASDYLENHPEDLATRLQYANDLHDSKLLDQAIAQYKIYLDTDPKNADARVDLGICYFELKKYELAIQEMETAVIDNPGHQLGHYNLGIVNLNAGNRDAARAWLIKARDLAPTSQYGINATQLLQQELSGQN
jgi:tetratricopeptide (TPR) repeat protein